MAEHATISLRRRLWLRISFATLLVWFAVAALMYERMLHEADEIYDAQLQQSARLLMGLLRAGKDHTGWSALAHSVPHADFDGVMEPHAIVDRLYTDAGRYERVIGFQLLDEAGNLLFRSPASPVETFAPSIEEGFSDVELDGIRWRLCAFEDSRSGFRLVAGEQYGVREEVGMYLLRSMILPLLIGLALLAVTVALAVYWGLSPLTRLAREVDNRSGDDLRPIDMAIAPIEVSSLTSALNRLLERFRHSFDRERRFTGDAAHELRTPLAALRVQSQVAQRAQSETERGDALKGVQEGVDRATHLVDQLLKLSRLDWQNGLDSPLVVDLSAAAERVARDFEPAAMAKRVGLVGDGQAGCLILADSELLSLLLRNLIDNAITYSPSGDSVAWRVALRDHKVIFELSDLGPGIPEKERERVFERFRRLPHCSGAGSGLGLSIVNRIAEQHGAEIHLGEGPSGRGLKVEVVFAAAAPADA